MVARPCFMRAANHASFRLSSDIQVSHKPLSVPANGQRSSLWDGQLPAASSSRPEADNGTSSPSLLLGLAPGGVCPAIPVTRDAVRFYRTVSPSPQPRKVRQYTSLWHFPAAYTAWPLASTVALWRADFPHPHHPARGAAQARSPVPPGHRKPHCSRAPPKNLSAGRDGCIQRKGQIIEPLYPPAPYPPRRRWERAGDRGVCPFPNLVPNVECTLRGE